MDTTHSLGIDIGGANLKFANDIGQVVHIPFALWQHPAQLADLIADTLPQFANVDSIAITMTGELADCFANKSEGVDSILRSVAKAVAVTEPAFAGNMIVYGFHGFESIEVAIPNPFRIAAANWHAIAQFASRQWDVENGLIIDCGSTTTDIIPIVDSAIAINRFSDTERLCDNTLVYSGVKRTPLMGLANEIIYREQTCRIANELFATTEDIYTLLGQIDICHKVSAVDGRGKSIKECRRRLAKMICADETEFDTNDALSIAGQFKQRQLESIQDAIRTQLNTFFTDNENTSFPELKMVICGEGDFLIQQVLEGLLDLPWKAKLIRVADHFSGNVSKAFGAYSVARLALNEDVRIQKSVAARS